MPGTQARILLEGTQKRGVCNWTNDCAYELLVRPTPVQGKTVQEPAYGPRILVPQPGRPLSCL